MQLVIRAISGAIVTLVHRAVDINAAVYTMNSVFDRALQLSCRQQYWKACSYADPPPLLVHYRHAGLQRVALLDFDVHHGNGTEACVSNTTPKTVRFAFSNALSDGLVVHHTYSPWRDVDDDKNVFFASVQGYGRKAPSTGGLA